MGYNTSFFSVGSGGGSGSSTFTGLTDTPSSYSGQAGKIPTVNPAEDGLIFEAASGGITPVDASYENVAEMVAATGLASGNIIQTYGYSTANDGGQMVYVVTDTDLSADVDGGSVIALADSLYAQAEFPPYYRPEMWGAKASNATADATTNTTAFNALFDYMVSYNRPLVMGGGTYFINGRVKMLWAKPEQNNYASGTYVIAGNGTTIRLTGFNSSSSTSIPMGTGRQTLTVSSGLKWEAGQSVMLSSEGNRMMAKVISYSGTSLVVDIVDYDGFMATAYTGSLVSLKVGDTTTNKNIPTASGNLAGFNTGDTIRLSTNRAYNGYQMIDALATVTARATSSVSFTITANNSAQIGSTTSRTIQTGNTSFATVPYGYGDAWPNDARVRATSVADPTAWMEGVVYSGSDPTVSIAIDTINGSGTFNDWILQCVGAERMDIQTYATTRTWGVAGGVDMFDRSVGTITQATNTPIQVAFKSATPTSLTSGTGTKTFTINPVIATDVTGYRVDLTLTNGAYMRGQVESYDNVTGAVTARIISSYLSSTSTSWEVQFSIASGYANLSKTSTTLLTIGTGSQTFTITPFGYDVTGYWCLLQYKDDTSDLMYGFVTAYNDSTGEVTVDVTNTSGTRVSNNWNVKFNMRNPVLQTTFSETIGYDIAALPVYLHYYEGDWFRGDTDARISAGGTILDYDSTTGQAGIMLTSAYGEFEVGVWEAKINAAFISDRMIGAKFNITNLNFTGPSKASATAGLKWSNSYGSSIKGCSFDNCGIGMMSRFNLSCTYEEFMLTGNDVGIWGSIGDWGNDNTQCNVSYVRNVRVFGQAQGFAGVRVTRSNAWTFIKYIHEGRGTRYGVWFDNRNDTTVKNQAMDFVHLETTCLSAFVKSDGGQLNLLTIRNLYSQFSNVDFQGVGAYINKIYNVGSCVYRGEQLGTVGENDTFDWNDATKFWDKRFNFYNLGISAKSLGGFRTPQGGSFDTGVSGVSFSWGTNMYLKPTYRGQFGNTSMNRMEFLTPSGELIGGSGNGVFGYPAKGLTLLSSGGNGITFYHPTSRNYFGFYQFGTSSAGSTLGRIRVRDDNAGTDLYFLPVHTATSNGQVWKFDDTSGSRLMEWGFVDFIELGDVAPSSYTGLAGAVAAVNSAETGMELVSSTDAGQTIVSGASSTSFGYLLGQVINRVWYRPATPATAALATAFRMDTGSKLSFKATSTTMTVTGQVFVEAGSGETISLALSTDGVTFSDAGSTETVVYENGSGGSHAMSTTLQFDFNVTGLTVGVAYEYFLALKSSSTTSTYSFGGTFPAIVLEAKHAS